MAKLSYLLNQKKMDDEVLAESVRAFHFSTGVTITAIDKKGMETYSCGNYPEFCEFFTECTQMAHMCHQEHLRGSKIAERLGEEYIFSCSAGLVHFAVPIVNGRVFCGALIGGPILMTEPDDVMVEDIMLRNKIPPHAQNKLLKYLKTVPVIQPERVRHLSKLLFTVSCSLIPEERFVLREHVEKNKQQSQIGESIQNLKLKEVTADNYSYERERELLAYVKNGDIIGAKMVLNDLLGVIFFHSGGNIEIIKIKILELCTLLSRAVVEGGAVLDNIFGMNYRFICELSTISNLEELSFWILKVLDKFTENVFHLPASKNAEIIKRVLHYINEHYDQNVALDSVANLVHLNTSYFSSLFKKEVGIGFSDYLNKVRIGKSKQLLVDVKYSISEISLMVGFEDQSYYSKVFKKMTGDTPKEFREKLK